jgi:hypothetical protein
MAGNDATTRATSVNRRNVLKGAAGAAAAAVAVGVRETAQAAEAPGPTPASGLSWAAEGAESTDIWRWRLAPDGHLRETQKGQTSDYVRCKESDYR